MVHVTQNHATPSIGHLFLIGSKTRFPAEYPWLMGGDDRYNEPTIQKCIEAIGMGGGEIGTGIGVNRSRRLDGRVAFNRRFIMRDGTAKCHPMPCDPDILHVEGPVDPSVGVAHR